MENDRPISIILADDHGIVREGLAAFFAAQTGYSVIEQCSDGQQAIDAITLRTPDFAILDLDMPGLSGLEVVSRVRAAGLPTKLIVLSFSRDLQKIRELFQAGANGYVLKDGPSRHIVEAIQFVRDGGRYLTPLIDMDQIAQPASTVNPLSTLSQRENEVYTLLVEGVRARDIAESLGLSPKTVDTYRANIMRKLEIDSLADLVRFAMQSTTPRKPKRKVSE